MSCSVVLHRVTEVARLSMMVTTINVYIYSARASSEAQIVHAAYGTYSILAYAIVPD